LESRDKTLRDRFMLPLEAMFLEVGCYLVERFGFGAERVIVTFWATKEPVTPELLQKVQTFLEAECGAVVTGTVNSAEHWLKEKRT